MSVYRFGRAAVGRWASAPLGDEPVRAVVKTGGAPAYASVETPTERLTIVAPRATTEVRGPAGSGVCMSVFFDRDEATAVVVDADGSMRCRPARCGEVVDL